MISDTYRGVLYPGGILNTGFAVAWAEDRQSDAEPAPDGGQRWATRRITGGDVTCATNQQLRAQTRDVLDEIRANAFYTPDRLDHVTPIRFVDRIAVPTFLAGAWQDEQTGGYWPSMIEHLSPDIPLKVTMTNGTHAEPFGPDVITRWVEFLDFYVGRRVPAIPADVRATAAVGYTALAGVPLELPPDRFAGETDYDAALARYEAEPPIRVLFDNGAGDASPGAPVAGFEASFPRWPLPEARAHAWYFGADGTLIGRAPDERRLPTRTGTTRRALPATDHPSGDDDFFDALPAYDWKPLPDGTAVAYATDPLRDDLVVLGPASVDLWLRSSATDTDLEVAITEVRPDGQRDVRAERLAARQSPQARPGRVDAAVPRAHTCARRRRRPARRQVLARPGADLPVRPRVPRRFAPPGRGAASWWQPTAMGLRRAPRSTTRS